VKIVPLTDEDRVSVRMLELACIREYVEQIMEKKWEDFDQEVRQKLGASASGSFSHYRDGGLSFVAKEGDKVVGFIFAQVIPWIDGIEKVAWVENIGVDQEFRRMGIGYLLMRRLAEESKKQGATVVHSSISPDNVPSLLLHRKLNFLAEDRKIAYLDLSTF